MNFNYFHIPTKIIQGYESFSNLAEIPELSKKRVVMVTSEALMSMGATQNLRRFIENISYGLIFYEAPSYMGGGLTSEAERLVYDSRAQTIIGFGNTQILSIARAMAQSASLNDSDKKVSYIEIPSIPCIYSGLSETYYVADEFDSLKKPYSSSASRAEWLLLDSSFLEYNKVQDILESSIYSLGLALDALFSRNMSMLGESYALKAIELIVSAGNRLPNEPANIKLKNELMLGSLLASFAVQSSDLGITAGLAMACESASVCSEPEAAAAVMLKSLEYSLVSNLDKFQRIFRILSLPDQKDPLNNAMKVLEIFQNLLKQMEIYPLSAFSYTENILDLIAKQASRYSFMINLSRPAGYYELAEIVKSAAREGINLSYDLNMSPVKDPVLI
ncbi:MAG: iron-containing alcohol dehydrogenase [Brevinemataceae bacterium]